MIYYIYKINFLCGEPGRYYIGKHCARDWNSADAYTGSGVFCKRYFKKYGKVDTYEKEILNFADTPKLLNEMEKLYIGTLYLTDECCVNMMAGGSGISEYKQDSKSKISIGNKGKVRTQEQRNATSKRFKGIPKTEEHKQHISESGKGKSHGHWSWSAEARERVKGRKRTEESKQKQSRSTKGIPKTEEHKAHIKEAKTLKVKCR